MITSAERQHFLQFKDFSRDEFDYLFERARWIKSSSSSPTSANTGR
jgi:ornithine carbamoyltransferase